mmetsp:Transcript_10930/g.11053  ORF Transcript_10930/g.11053 Transcript_10930/m.11053 type:complete len:96 (-) Transcript_10930:98-385(-)
MDADTYRTTQCIDLLPPKQQEYMVHQWGPDPHRKSPTSTNVKSPSPGSNLGTSLWPCPPACGYGMDPNKIYRTPDIPQPHNYYALYKWLRVDLEG